VFLAYASPRGRALVDRELYVPTSWTEDALRCAAAGIPPEVSFATKPQLGLAMLARAQAAGVLSGWVTADEVYGQNPTFRAWLAERGVPFVLATRSDDMLTCPDGHRHQAKNLAALVGERTWERRSAGSGAHGARVYDWTVVALDPAGLPAGWSHGLLVRRQTDPSLGKAPELAFYRCAGPASTPVPELIRIAGARWAIEECLCATRRSAVFPV
jgi:SRSO17 transposase